MGDRGVIYMKQGERGFYLYSHWSGHHLPRVVSQALRAGRDRWDDASYFARIVFEQLIRGDRDGLTGFGIQADEPSDNEHAILVVDCDTQTIGIAPKGGEPPVAVKTWPMARFVEFTDRQIDDLGEADRRLEKAVLP
jgi:hypothetical protein